MKKYLVSALAIAMLASLSVSAAEFSASNANNNAITVDGVKDVAYVNDGFAINVAEATEGGATGTGYAAWDDENLYLYVEVNDDTVTPAADVTSVYMNDSIEIYINLAGEDGAIADINAAQYTIGPSFTTWAGGGLHRTNYMDAAEFAYTYTDFGYTLEVAIPWGDEYAVDADAVIPFCVGINDDADGDANTREYHNFTGANQGAAWSTADSNWDSLKMTTDEYVEPVVETEPEVVADAATEDVVAAPQTFDAAIVAAVAAVVSAAGYAVSKKR